MLELKNIVKDYPAGGGVVHALKGISLKFRKAEFVSILGPSGCGKTTMLNIVGGLDKYTEGDLCINGRSTKDFKARDWDSYRNHSIGFVFQNYNLIPHQTVLANVELALTLSGVGRNERRKRAKEVLCKVGLDDQMNKKPNSMSGGQMQRVAIARALVNNPDIVLADEPTGALDSETSVQIMELLKEVSRDRLVIMVTHNPELAEQYSSRIIKMLDGVIRDDSNPVTDAEPKDGENINGKRTGKKEKKPSMSLGTSFGLSLKNLITKKGRTILTAFAGSIGIIGIAMILAMSTGMTTYINTVQEETLASYPITLQATTIDLTSIMETFMGTKSETVSHENDGVYRKSAAYDMVNAVNSMEESTNDLYSFNKSLEAEMGNEEGSLNQAINGIQYTYDLNMLIYTKNIDEKIEVADTQELLSELLMEHMGLDLEAMSSFGSMSSLSSLSSSMSGMSAMGGSSNLWEEFIPGKDGSYVNDLIKDEYDVIYGSWPENYDELVLVVDENNEIDDITLYALGLIPKEEMDEMMEAAANGEQIEAPDQSWSYEDICSLEYRTIFNSDCYTYNDETGIWEDLRDTDAGIRYLYDNATPLKVVGIIKPNEDSSSHILSGTICYTDRLTEYVINNSKDAEIIEAQMDTPTIDVLTGLPFEENTNNLSDAEKQEALKEYIEGMNRAKKAEIYVKIKSIPDDEYLDGQEEEIVGDMSREDMEETILSAFSEEMSVSEEEIKDYLENMEDDELDEIFRTMVREQVKQAYAAQTAASFVYMSEEQLEAALDEELPDYTAEECAKYYDEVVEFSENTYDENLTAMGNIDLDNPASINIYASSFENKDVITDFISAYNDTVSELYKIEYTDYAGIIMKSVTTIINAITYVLIAFVAISLIVSSIMIGVITLISVQERTKEIGILRAIGASKKNISSLFNAETLIIGFASGLIGVLVTYLLCIPINLILRVLTGINSLGAALPLSAAVILVLISMLLTLIAGIIPSRSAAKKDPAVALRTE